MMSKFVIEKAGANMRRFLGKLGMTVVLLSPVALAAQPGVTITGLAVEAGTVTLDVRWEPLAPTTVWSDTVWVFVDYNDNGTMKRLELSEGATLTATSAPDVGRVIQYSDNNKGVWVVGNARSVGSFSATVKLLTATANVAGACAYASNYPPVGEYATASSITFTGTPPFDLVLSTGTESVPKGYELQGEQTLLSFTDKTGAPGIIIPKPISLTANPAVICEGASATLTAVAAGAASYSFDNGDTWQPAATKVVSLTANTNYTLKVLSATSYVSSDSKTTSIAVHGAISPGSITTETSTTNAGTAPSVTITSTGDASGGSGSLAYEWRRTGKSATTLNNSDATTYALDSDNTNYSTAGTYYFNRYAKDATCNTSWVAATGTYTLTVKGVNQPQGSCTFTQPAEVGTFASFSSTYSASTFVTLTDERDSKNYTVVKIGDRWIMAQNLNYQGVAGTSSSLTWQANSNMPSTGEGSNTALIGHFWCPGGYSTSSPTSTRASCDVWGALYSWETAMMLDGKGTWTETDGGGYCTDAASTDACKRNWGRSASSGTAISGRGICPPNWHVPTDNEWGIILDGMESSGVSTVHQNASSLGYIGSNAGARGKSTCSCPKGTITGNSCVDDEEANWYYKDKFGTDAYGFRALPAGYRYADGSSFADRGNHWYVWSSSVVSTTHTRRRGFGRDNDGANHNNSTRSHGFSVRCIMNL